MKLKRIQCFSMNIRKVLELLHEKRAVSAVISNVILTGAVIAVSFVVLFWAQYRSSAYNDQYGEAMNADIARLKERLAFEYVFYNNSKKQLSVYLINCGTIGNVTIQTVYVKNNTWSSTFSKSQIDLKFMSGTSRPMPQELDIGGEGYFVLSSVGLVTGKSYSVRIVTGRGSIFESMFAA